MRLIGLLSVTGWAFASAAGAMSVEAQQAAARAAAFAPEQTRTATPPSPIPFADVTPRGAPSLSWLSLDTYAAGPADRFSVATLSKRVVPGAVLGPQSQETLQPAAYDLSFTRSWPSAFSLSAGKFDIDLTPHAGIGSGDSGGTAEAGAMVRFGRNLGEKVEQRLGMRESASFGNQARWYLFAASSGTAVGLNLLRNDGDWRRAGVSEDAASAIIGDTQAGFGWRRGSMAASLGYVHREVKIRQGLEGLMGAGDRKDDLVSLSFTIKQH